jgi:L-fuconolactonase
MNQNAAPDSAIPVDPPVIDAHIHLWDLSVYTRRDWLQDKPQLIRDFLPSDAVEAFDTAAVTHGIIVEAVKYSQADNVEWLSMSLAHPRLLGAVTGCFLDDPDLPHLLDRYAQWDSFLGVRATPRRDVNNWGHLDAMASSLDLLARRGVPLEILAQPRDLGDIARIAAAFPELTLIVDHCGLPDPDSVRSGEWSAGIERLAPHRNVYVKYSGLAMAGKGLADHRFFAAVASTLFAALGPGQLIAGSNWPVDSLWADYRSAWNFGLGLLPKGLTAGEQRMVYAENALRAYRVPVPKGVEQ